LLLVYAGTRAALGFGARMSGMYADPSLEPLTFLRGALERYPVLVGDLVFGLRANWWTGGFPWAIAFHDWGLVPRWMVTDIRYFRGIQAALGVIGIVVLGLVGRSVMRARRADSAGSSVAFVSWALPLALVPLLGSTPESRLMLPAAFGWSILLARYSVVLWTRPAAGGGWLRRIRFELLALWFPALITPLLTSANEARNFPRLAQAVRTSILDPRLDRSITADSRVLLASALDPTTTLYVPLLRRWYGRSTPASCHLLLSAASRLRLQRLSDHGFALERADRSFSASDAYAGIFNREPLRAGQRVAAGTLTATIDDAVEGRPMRVRYELDLSLDDPRTVLLVQSTHGLLRHAFPPPGKSIWLEQALPPLDFMPH
jgi:hypothetical protein